LNAINKKGFPDKLLSGIAQCGLEKGPPRQNGEHESLNLGLWLDLFLNTGLHLEPHSLAKPQDRDSPPQGVDHVEDQ